MSKVYFTRTITSEQVVKMFEYLGVKLEGKVAVKVHSGERGNQNFLHPIFMKPMVDHVNGTIVECNTAYGGSRNTTEKHEKLLLDHGWKTYFNVDLMDKDSDFEVEIPNGQRIKKDYLGTGIKKYDSLLVLSHFKGHPMGGFGGALKQLSIGFGSSAGKSYIHSSGRTTDQYKLWSTELPQDEFIESMADAASLVDGMFKGKVAYINVICNLSVDCDCCSPAEDPCMKDIGIVASTDPVAIDKACVDLIYNSTDPGRDHFVERIERQHGTYIFDACKNINFGSTEYELIDVDK